MERPLRYTYRIDLKTTDDVREFTKIASRCEGRIYVTNGDKTLSAKSFLGVYLAKTSWNTISVESDFDCFFDFRRFIVKNN
ncbi:MAG: HPr family phosphocarrier protein [Clostridia bacterium]|nr:HPr family phosphocarrier protein [Clostridia bacterium]MBR6290561.1 HPr family phosphocarrier protein [Clostridia bacterium]